MKGSACKISEFDLPLGLHDDEADVASLAHGQDLADVVEILQCHGLRGATHFLDVDFLLNTQGLVHVLIQKIVIA